MRYLIIACKETANNPEVIFETKDLKVAKETYKQVRRLNDLNCPMTKALRDEFYEILDELEKGAGRVVSMLHGRVYADGEDDFSKIGFEGVEEAAAITTSTAKVKGAA